MKLPSHPPRSGEDDPRVQRALEIAKSYRPSEQRIERALARLETSRASGTGPSTALASRDGRGLFSLKVVGALGGIALVLAGFTLHRWNHAPEETATATTLLATPANTVAEVPQTPEQPTLRVDELPTVNPPAITPPSPAPLVPGEKSLARADKSAPRSTTDTTAAATAPAAAFDEELALVESARTSLANGSPAACLAKLDDYEHRVHGGVFEREVAVIRIEALLAQGESERARSLGEAFLAKSPESPYANRIRSVLARIPSANTKTP